MLLSLREPFHLDREHQMATVADVPKPAIVADQGKDQIGESIARVCSVQAGRSLHTRASTRPPIVAELDEDADAMRASERARNFTHPNPVCTSRSEGGMVNAEGCVLALT